MNEQLRNALPHKNTPFFRMLHTIVATLVLLQIISPNLTGGETLRDITLTGVVTWFHVISGFTLMVLGVAVPIWILKQRGFRYYFVWPSLDFRGIVEDIKVLVAFRLPEAHAGGIAAMIQGLDALTLLAVALCGGLWFVLDTTPGTSAALAEAVLRLHKFLTVFIEIYFQVHDAMGLLHIFLTFHGQKKHPVIE